MADIVKKNGYTEIVFLDDNESIAVCGGYPVASRSADAAGMNADLVVAIGNAEIRKRLQESINESR